MGIFLAIGLLAGIFLLGCVVEKCYRYTNKKNEGKQPLYNPTNMYNES